MNISNYNAGSFIRKAIFVAAAILFVTGGGWAQDTTATNIRHGRPSHETVVRNATVVYVEGNDLVLKLENGKVEHLVVPDSDKFHIDGKIVSVAGLTPGTRLTESITTTTTPHYVNTVRVLKGKVWHVNAPHSLIVSLPDGTNHRYIVPSHARFTVNGQRKTVFDLRKGMSFEATIVTDEPQTVVSSNRTVVGQAPAPALPQAVGVLLIQPVIRQVELAQQPEGTVEVASNESLPAALPKTGSLLPLSGLLGGMAVAVSLGMGTLRKRFNV